MDGETAARQVEKEKWLLCPDIPKYFAGTGKSMLLHILKSPLIPGN